MTLAWRLRTQRLRSTYALGRYIRTQPLFQALWQACVLIHGGAPFGCRAPMAGAPVATSTAAEEARTKYGIGHFEVIELDALDAHPHNRSGLGVSAFHAHRVARSIITDGFSRHRYRDATVVMVPAAEAAQFRKFNETMSANDPKLPPNSPKAKFALLSKNHLVTALKLLRLGSHTMADSGEPIVANPQDVALAKAMREGIYCDVLGEALWNDPDALKAIMAEDNLNACVEMGTNEVEILAFMADELKEKSELSSKMRFEQIVRKARSRFGCSAFSDADFLNLHNFAVRVSVNSLRNWCAMHFALVPASTLRCKSVEYDSIARLDKSIVVGKIALVVSLYLGGTPTESGVMRRSAVGGVAQLCKGIAKETLKQFEENPSILQTAELFLKTMLKHYCVQNEGVHVKKLLECRARLYYRIGRLAQTWPDTEFSVKKTLASIENKYAAEMADAGAIKQTLPRKYAMPVMIKTVPPTAKVAAADAEKASIPSRLKVEVLGDDDLGMPDDGAGSNSEATKAHDIGESQVAGVPREPWEQLAPELWRRMASETLLHVYAMTSDSVDKVQVVRAESAIPQVWQARALANIAPKKLILVPWVKSAPAEVDADEPAPKRPKDLHPALPDHEVMRVEAKGCTDAPRFLLRSPLGGKIGTCAPAPFWCVLSRPEPHLANMEYRDCTAEVVAPTCSLESLKKGEGLKLPKVKVQLTIRALINNCNIQRGDVLTVHIPEATAPAQKKARTGDAPTQGGAPAS